MPRSAVMSVCLAISMPRSQVIDRINVVGNPLMVVEIAMRRVSASRLGRCIRRIMRVCRSTRVPIAERWFLPTMRSPSVRLKLAREGWVWLRSPCVSDAHWERPPSSPWAP